MFLSYPNMTRQLFFAVRLIRVPDELGWNFKFLEAPFCANFNVLVQHTIDRLSDIEQSRIQ